MRNGLSVVLFLAYLLLSTSTMAWAQEQPAMPVQSKYSQVIDRLFQFSRGAPAEFYGIRHRVVIRFLPSSGAPESQIVLLQRDDGTIRIIRYTLKPGAQPITERCEEILDKNARATVGDILKDISVEKVERVGDSSTVKLLEDLFRLSIPTKFVSDLFSADGTTYELWIQTPQNEIHVRFSDQAYGESTESVPMVQWVKKVHTEFQDRR